MDKGHKWNDLDAKVEYGVDGAVSRILHCKNEISHIDNNTPLIDWHTNGLMRYEKFYIRGLHGGIIIFWKSDGTVEQCYPLL